MKAEGCNAQKYIATLQLSYANAIIGIYTLIPHCHGNGLVISIFMIHVRLSDGFMDIHRVHGLMCERLIGCLIVTDNEV